jgi:hypothetical protein
VTQYHFAATTAHCCQTAYLLFILQT